MQCSASAKEGFRLMSHAIPILLYHRIDESGLPTATTPEEFNLHLQWLHERGWRTLTADAFTALLRSRKPLPAHSFVITFDDGYESLASAAFPILQQFGYSAICFLSTRHVRGAYGRNPAPPPGRDGKLFLDWNQVRALQSCGVIDFQSHTHTHSDFRTCSTAQIADDLSISREILMRELALPALRFEHLAWPWGQSTPEWRALARRTGYRYQYTVSRQSFQRHTACDEIPRTCFDAAAFSHFRRQFWLQSGLLAGMWNLAYPFGRRLRHLAGF